MKTAPQIQLAEDERTRLESIVRSRCISVRLAERARIVLLAAGGHENMEIGEKLGISRQKVGRWRNRYAEQGYSGIEKDVQRSGRPPVHKRSLSDEIIRKTQEEVPQNATHWSRQTMAEAVNVSPSTVGRIWRKNGLKPHLVNVFKLSNDKHFVEKLEDIVGLYLSPPEHAIVLSCDEKSQIQALDRTQPSLPIKKGRCGTMTHDYRRNGTTSLFAALNIADGKVVGTCMKRHRHQEWLKFLNLLKRSTPKDKEVHIICDNYATHKHASVKEWQERNKRFHFHFTPTSASWLNMVERFFRDITERRIRRGVFRSTIELEVAISDYIQAHNDNPKPFIWTAKATDILEKVKRARESLIKLQD
ncbi:MAG: IS630 family transposase [Proteobacteria bacterium]|nr:IS630 family transposase [Pseudomonadota bacterium]MBU1737054.1 IS630 family transposase [Pseudomonadota bacterium]